LRDPMIGPAVSSWLNLSSPSDILSIGGEPVLVDWGFLPKAISATDPAQLSQHFARTLGRYFSPTVALPPIHVPPIPPAPAAPPGARARCRGPASRPRCPRPIPPPAASPGSGAAAPAVARAPDRPRRGGSRAVRPVATGRAGLSRRERRRARFLRGSAVARL